MADDNSVDTQGTPPDEYWHAADVSRLFRQERERSANIQAENDQLRVLNNEILSRCRFLLRTAENYRQRNEQLEQNLLLERENTRQARQDNDTLREKIEALEKSITNQQTTEQFNRLLLSVVQHERDTANQENETLQQREMALNEQLGALQFQYDDLQQKAEIEKEQAIASQQAANESLVVLRQEVVTHTETNATLQARCDELQSHNERLRQEAESAIASQQAANRSNQQQIAELRAQLDEEREKNETSRLKISELELYSGNLRAEKEAQQRAIGNLRAEKEVLLEQNDNLTAENLERFVEGIQNRQDNDELQYELGDVEWQLEELQDEFNEKGRENDLLQQEIESKDQEIERLKEIIKNSSGSSVTPDDPQPTTAVTPAPLPSKRVQSMTTTTKSSSAESESRSPTEMPTSVTPTPLPSKRDQSMTATTESSASTESKSQKQKRSRVSHKPTSNAQPQLKKSRNLWSKAEDAKLTADVNKYKVANKTVSWKNIAKEYPGRKANALESRYTNILDPTKKRGPISKTETKIFMTLQCYIDEKNGWTFIAGVMNRTSSDVAAFWKNFILPALKKEGIYNDEGNFGLHKGNLDTALEKVWPHINKQNKGVKTAPSGETPVQVSDPDYLSQIAAKANRDNAAKKERVKKKEKDRNRVADVKEKLRSMLITEDQKKELANPNSNVEWVKETHDAQKRLLAAGFTQEKLDRLAEYYRSSLVSGKFKAEIIDETDKRKRKRK